MRNALIVLGVVLAGLVAAGVWLSGNGDAQDADDGADEATSAGVGVVRVQDDAPRRPIAVDERSPTDDLPPAPEPVEAATARKPH